MDDYLIYYLLKINRKIFQNDSHKFEVGDTFGKGYHHFGGKSSIFLCFWRARRYEPPSSMPILRTLEGPPWIHFKNRTLPTSPSTFHLQNHLHHLAPKSHRVHELLMGKLQPQLCKNPMRMHLCVPVNLDTTRCIACTHATAQ